MYTGRVVCCPLVSRVEYASCAVSRLEKIWDRRTHRWTDRVAGNLLFL